MIIKTEDFKNVASTILPAVSDQAANLAIKVHNGRFFLIVASNDYSVVKSFAVEDTSEHAAVVDAKLFLDLVAKLASETFELQFADRYLAISTGTKGGKKTAGYKLPMIYNNDALAELPIIKIENKTVEMNISRDILKSILTINSKEIAKAKNLDVNELQQLYYVDETGCFSYTTGAVLNRFTLEKPIKLLLTDKVVKLFKLFNSDVYFSFGHDVNASGLKTTKVTFETEDTYVAAMILSDDRQLNSMQGPINATKRLAFETVYPNNVVVDATDLGNALGRLLTFTKNSVDSVNKYCILGDMVLEDGFILLKDALGNEESVMIENDSIVETGYTAKINLTDLEIAVNNFKNEHVTINCGNEGNAVVITCGPVINLIPKAKHN